ncbi:MAG: PHP domain-containing protein [Candidatus Absconditabacteria bacterium]
MIHLHGQSHYSLLNGIGSPERILNKAKELGMNAIGISDLGAMYGGLEFYEKSLKAGIKAIIGVEICLVNSISKQEINEPITNIVLIAKDVIGYQNLLRIVSIANLDGYKDRARVDYDVLEKYKDGLLTIIGGINSKIAHMHKMKEKDEIVIDFLDKLKAILGEDNVYLELIAQDENKIKAVYEINHYIKKLADKTQTMLTLGTDFHYINKEEKKAFEALNCIREGVELSLNTETILGQHHILNEDEVIKIMKKNNYDEEFVNSLIGNNEKVAEKINLKIPLGQLLFPKYESPEYIIKMYDKVKDGLELE